MLEQLSLGEIAFAALLGMCRAKTTCSRSRRWSACC
jgi:hypothetical protein